MEQRGETVNLQDAFLNQVRIAQTPVTVYLTGGHQLRGLIRGFDTFVLVMDIAGKDSIVYKHAITTITPKDPVRYMKTGEQKTEAGENADGQTD